MDGVIHEKTLKILEESFENRCVRYAPGNGGPAAGDPIASVFPRDAGEVEFLARLAAHHSLPLAARGAGTALYPGAAGGTVEVRFDLMRDVRLPESGEAWVEVGPGATWMSLENALSAGGKSTTVYPTSAPRATVGGWLAENGLGIGAYEYGWLLENVLSVEAVLAGGERMTLEGEPAGYLVGSRGSAGFVVEARLKTRAAGEDVAVAFAFRTPEGLAGAILDLYWSRAPLWHLAFLNPRMARARGLEGEYVLFGAYPGGRAPGVEPALGRAVRSHRGRVLSGPEAARIWEQRFFPVSPLGPTPTPGRAVVWAPGLAPVLRELERGRAAVQGTVARAGEVWLLAFDSGEDAGLLDLEADGELLRAAGGSWRHSWR